MKILHVVGNKIEASNGIGRLIPEMISMHNKFGSFTSSLLVFEDLYESFDFDVSNYNNIKDRITFFSEFDLVVFHGLYFLKFIKIKKILAKLGTPYLVKPHSSLMVSAQKKSYLKKILANALFFNSFVNNAAGVIYTNADEKINSRVLNNANYIEPNGIDFSLFDSEILPDIKRVTSSISEPSVKFIYLSRIDFSHKGTDILLDALDLIKSRGEISRIHLDIYGKGPSSEERITIERVASLDSSHISFKGPIYGVDKVRAFKSSDVFVLTSRYEGFPMAILEALYCGLPCIVTPGANMNDILSCNDVGWLTRLDAESVADTLLQVSTLKDGSISSKSDFARDYVINNHEWSKVVKITENIYRSVIENAS
ncbi:glycosyltransferase [Shewanella baltica]|uniref:glycosyltransferase n=1 Tax=Shewanella baltica TaxID=62322 RepID=UPI00217EF87B|nr:glycosyltransferase [Shewanella baltica]MCS6126354.1 glycosyltransferase [Shewanella baltica]MCS6137676.1 glycosyltransferase [Shewanella baltica]MCS6144809.1 glycosyltransferase [Shewanella baltica]MCS6159429.1 glycosyltransferase [Shewanella baltica]MCS6169338.1 glycosyltransferase [Shewanella baltica]